MRAIPHFVLVAALTTSLAAGLVACGSDQPTAKPASDAAESRIKVSGQVGYRERIALLPGSTLVVKINDISRADAPAQQLASQRIDLTGRSVPVDFELSVPASEFQANHRYALRAEIRGNGDQLLWTTDQIQPVDPAKADQRLELITLVKVAGNKPASGDSSSGNRAGDSADNGLSGANWRVEDLAGRGVIDNSQTTLQFTAEGLVSGIAGCNRFTGTYKIQNGTLSFSPLAVTRRACIPALDDQEQRFLALMQKVDRYSVDPTGALLLKTSDGQTMLARKVSL